MSRVEYNPTLYVPSRKTSDYQTLTGEYVEPMPMGTIKDAKQFAKKYEGVDNFKIYGSTKFAYVYLNEKFGNDYDVDQVKVANIDIEVGSEEGFPNPDLAYSASHCYLYIIRPPQRQQALSCNWVMVSMSELVTMFTILMPKMRCVYYLYS